jgi:hypothetical protein
MGNPHSLWSRINRVEWRPGRAALTAALAVMHLPAVIPHLSEFEGDTILAHLQATLPAPPREPEG